MENENPDLVCNKKYVDSETCTPGDSCSGSSFCMCSQHFPSINAANQVTHMTTSWTQQEDKKSFASIMAASCVSPAKHVRQRRVLSCSSFPKAPVPTKNYPTTEITNGQSYGIFVANLPKDATVEQLEPEFKKFGPIKPHGIKVRSNKQQESWFCFVEFDHASSMQAALKASIVLDGRRLSIRKKRDNNDRLNHSSGQVAINGVMSKGESSQEDQMAAKDKILSRADQNNGTEAAASLEVKELPTNGGPIKMDV